ncbi:axoneme-associated protein [Forsythia ovata]|uniref:Axoneme-associated protein n=1 Tax=Forsythia ovata TaxID=205694 RepID=A0ABD1X9E5_9LAMI
MRPMIDERDKLKKDLEVAKFDVAEFSKRCNLANQAQKITAKAFDKANTQREGVMDRITQLEEANAQRKRLMDKIAQLEKMVESLRAKCYDLNGENLSLKSETDEAVKAIVEDFRSHFEFTPNYENFQTFYINFGARQVLTKVNELYPNLDLSTIEVDYPALEEAKD